jgi:hypothetical protein
MLILTNQKDGNATQNMHAIPYAVATEIVEIEAETYGDASQWHLVMHMIDGTDISLGNYPDDVAMKAALAKIDSVVDFTYYPNPAK